MSVFTKIIDLQNLNRAWEHVRKKHPVQGTDRITWEGFENNKKLYLQQLKIELSDGRYNPKPVKLIELQKEEKVREVCVFSIRDKVVQQSVVTELSKIYEPVFPKCSYAYRQGCSALLAADEIERAVKSMGEGFFLRGDIRHFFDNVVQEKLIDIIREKVNEKEVLNLIRVILKARALDEQGQLTEKEKGIYQGSVLSPFLSNIYMLGFDTELDREGTFFARYSDDFVLLERSIDRAAQVEDIIVKHLNELGLELHKEKTFAGRCKDGFDFLGYHFDATGKSTPVKAEMHLQETLEDMWISSEEDIEAKIEKGLDIVRGWEQYYHDNKDSGSILEFVLKIYSVLDDELLDVGDLIEQRKKLNNPYRDVFLFMIEYWKRSGHGEMCLFEYEDYYDWGVGECAFGNETLNDIMVKELIPMYEKYSRMPVADNLNEIMQQYSDLGFVQGG